MDAKEQQKMIQELEGSDRDLGKNSPYWSVLFQFCWPFFTFTLQASVCRASVQEHF